VKIIVDAMGGDNAPGAAVRGAVQAAGDFGCEVILVGRGGEILQILESDGNKSLPPGVEIAHADQVVEMDDNPSTAFKEKKDSSLTIALGLLRDGAGDAVVSAGSTGALLSASTLMVKRIRGIRRAALAPVIPTAQDGTVLIDCGANAESKPEHLLQFAYMGSFYAERVLHRPEPRIGLLNIGAEAGKGTPLRQLTYTVLQKADEEGRIHFVGNVEGREAVLGQADVIVTAGFTGNVFLKTLEGSALFFSGELRNIFLKNWKTKLSASLLQSEIKAFRQRLDSREIGGTALLGISKPVIKAHGSSAQYAVRNAIRQAMLCVSSGLIDDITENIDFMHISDDEENLVNN
jgi:glycerol-3-phosphate acyltransferase PlsX